MDYSRAEGILLSLQSPFPNEHEVALNTALVLSSALEAENRRLCEFLGSRPVFIRLLLAHAGFFEDCELRSLITDAYRGGCGVDLTSFWRDVTGADEGSSGRDLLCECSPQLLEFRHGMLSGMGLEFWGGEDSLGFDGIWGAMVKCCGGCQVAVKEEEERDEVEIDDLWGYPDFVDDRLGARVELVAAILRNLSFECGAAAVMARSGTMLRFLLVAGRCEYGSLSRTSFDIISNLGPFLGSGSGGGVEPTGGLSCLYSLLTDLVVETVMFSKDCGKLLRCLEAISGAFRSRDEMNCLYLKDWLLIERVCELMAGAKESGVPLVLGCLEYILELTSTGRLACDTLTTVPGAVGLLKNFVLLGARDLFGEGYMADLALSQDGVPFTELVTEIHAPIPAMELEPAEETPRSRSRPQRRNLELELDPLPQDQNEAPTPTTLKIRKDEDMVKLSVDQALLKAHEESLRRVMGLESLQMAKFSNPHQPQVLTDNCDEGQMTKKRKMKNNPLVTGKTVHFVEAAPKIPNKPSVQVITPAGKPALASASAITELLDKIAPFFCEWEGCGKRFISKDKLRQHVYIHFVGAGPLKLPCKWGRTTTPEECSRSMTKSELVIHMETHYRDTDLEAALHARQFPTSVPRNGATAARPQKSLVSVEAWRVLRKYQTLGKSFKELKNVDWSEGPGAEAGGQPVPVPLEEDVVTKSIRLTAALALRNIAKFSLSGRKSIKRFEVELGSVAMSGRDCAWGVAQVLYYLGLKGLYEENEPRAETKTMNMTDTEPDLMKVIE